MKPMFNKKTVFHKRVITLVISILMIFSAALCHALTYPGLGIGKNTCSMPDTGGRMFFEFRGTGYFWLEHYYRGFPDERQLILLVESATPIFQDRKATVGMEFNCKDQTILNFLWLPETMSQGSPEFDCFVRQDQPLPTGELVFGYVDNLEVGLQKSHMAWKAVVHPFGKGGSISPVDKGLDVYCTIHPGMD